MNKLKLKTILNILGLYLILFIIFGGAYKTPLGNISVIHLNFLWGITLVFLIFFTSNEKKIKYMKNKNLFFMYLLLIILLLIPSLINYSFFNIGDIQFIELQLKRIAQLLISFLLLPIIIYHVIKNLTQKQFFITLFSFLLFVLFLCIYQLSNEQFRIWYLNITAIDGYWYEWAQKSNRAIGLKAMSIWDTSISYALFVFIGFSSYFYNKNKIAKIWYHLYFLIIFLLIIISGRTGLLLFLFFMVSLSIQHKRYSFLTSLFIFSLVGILFLIYNFENEIIINIISFSFELFMNFFNGSLETNSTNDLIENHLFLPDLNNILFGDNIFIGDGDEIISKIGRSSDSAFVINYVAYGLFGLLITTLMVIVTSAMLFFLFQHNKKNRFYYILLVLCLMASIGLYTKILIYVSATLLKAIVFVTMIVYSLSPSSVLKFKGE
ncbi:hypothetical protein AB7W88_17365 [Providencia vermicola]|uniref:hypothetical protein n=1 Tax=Providencia TaxID=586 RepID=UPI00234AF4DA|nr:MULTISPECIES: hypothetical protein [unclassified Providencia]